MRRMRRWRPYPVDESCKLYLPFYKFGAEQTKILDISTSHNDGTISGCVPVAYPMTIPIASGTVTLANMKISYLNGGATASGGSLVDFSAANVLTDYIDHLLVIKDSSNRVIQGFIKAAGTEETLAATGGPLNNGELLTNPSFDVDTTGWDVSNCTIASSHPAGGGQSDDYLILTRTSATTPQQATQVYASFTVGALYKLSSYIKSGTSGNQACFIRLRDYLSSGINVDIPGTTNGSWVNLIGYANAVYETLRFSLNKNTSTDGTMLFDEVSVKQVLTPSSTGVTIVNSKGGVTYNWLGKDANFNYNDSSNYSYAIYSVPGYIGLGWFADGTDDRIVHSSLNLGTTHTLHYWLFYQGISGVIHGGAANYHGMRLSPTACGYNVGTTEVTVTHSATVGEPVLFSIDRNGTSVTFYKNGVQIGDAQTLGANTAQVLTSFFRYSNGTSYWNGIIFDAVNINTNKGAQEIRNFFEMTRSVYGV